MENANTINTPKIIALSGSLRKDSYNDAMVKIAESGAIEAGADVQHINLIDFHSNYSDGKGIPLFDEDTEKVNGVPDAVIELKKLFQEADGILIASPEYNGSIPGVFKNALDWLSRPEDKTSGESAFSGKVVGLMAASPGGLGGLRGLTHVREIMTNLGSIALPTQVTVPDAYKAFDEQGNLTDERKHNNTKQIGEAVANMIAQQKK